MTLDVMGRHEEKLVKVAQAVRDVRADTKGDDLSLPVIFDYVRWWIAREPARAKVSATVRKELQRRGQR